MVQVWARMFMQMYIKKETNKFEQLLYEQKLHQNISIFWHYLGYSHLRTVVLNHWIWNNMVPQTAGTIQSINQSLSQSVYQLISLSVCRLSAS